MYGICYITWARLPSVDSWVQFLDQLPAAMTQHQQLDASVLLGMSPGPSGRTYAPWATCSALAQPSCTALAVILVSANKLRDAGDEMLMDVLETQRFLPRAGCTYMWTT